MATARIGLLFSTTGPYSALGRSALDGALMAVAEVNARNGLTLVPVCADPRGVPADYERLAAELLSRGDLRHIVGGITSWSRKDMIPVMERHGALLWYPCPYEGFECNDHVVYLGACPNQHLVPLIDHVLRKGHRRAFLVGSNCVWGWETLRVAREWFAGGQGGEVTSERYLPLGDTDCGHLIEEIAAQQPDLIVNSLIGPSSHAFMQALSRLDLPGGRPLVISANQTEADLDILGPAADGMLSIGPGSRRWTICPRSRSATASPGITERPTGHPATLPRPIRRFTCWPAGWSAPGMTIRARCSRRWRAAPRTRCWGR